MLNRAGRFAGFDEWQRYLVALHELMHIVLWKQRGAGWDACSGLTHRCASVLADSSRCIFRQHRLTVFDRSEITRRYGKEPQ